MIPLRNTPRPEGCGLRARDISFSPSVYPEWPRDLRALFGVEVDRLRCYCVPLMGCFAWPQQPGVVVPH
jgi:hypothetical protein